ncbi:hypothetical protein AG1IA_02000 [Rhizoctonia solani AG-1 IA]|uniref:Uncharacterized protein n=1 Tax=Thanatephorus cucumeris (strain AG1-IA) TaxID=983506 RepID=L8X0W7_THACA|nr:hypothetical protein AG1IA_02000 [Rhizoctonia solani AG-1 IA]
MTSSESHDPGALEWYIQHYKSGLLYGATSIIEQKRLFVSPERYPTNDIFTAESDCPAVTKTIDKRPDPKSSPISTCSYVAMSSHDESDVIQALNCLRRPSHAHG